MRFNFHTSFIFLILGFGISVVGASNAELSFPAKSSESPQFWTDLCFYRGAQDYTQIELYYSIAAKELKFEESDDKIIASYAYSLTISNMQDEVLINESRRKQILVNSTDEANDRDKGSIDQLVFDLKPDIYKFELEFLDEHNQAKSNIAGNFKVPRFTDELQISTPQLAALISTKKTQPLFLKGNKTVIPNASRKFQFAKSYLYIYFEVYNLTDPVNDSNQDFEITYAVTDSRGDTLVFVPRQTVHKPGTSCIKTQTLNIFDLEPAEYDLLIQITDGSPQRTISASSNFWVYEPRGVLSMSEEDIKKYRDQIKYFASPRELDIFDDLGPDGLENFLVNFWHRRDTSPETPENEFMQNAFARIAYAEEHFKGRDGGLNSDMGRIFVTYGQPDEIEDFSMNMDGKPYIIWHYYTSGSGKHEFVFVDKSADGRYLLVHSTYQNEVQNRFWREQDL